MMYFLIQAAQAGLKSKISYFLFLRLGCSFHMFCHGFPPQQLPVSVQMSLTALKWPHDLPVGNSVLPSFASCPPCPLPLLTFSPSNPLPPDTLYQCSALFCGSPSTLPPSTGPGIQICLGFAKCRHCWVPALSSTQQAQGEPKEKRSPCVLSSWPDGKSYLTCSHLACDLPKTALEIPLACLMENLLAESGDGWDQSISEGKKGGKARWKKWSLCVVTLLGKMVSHSTWRQSLNSDA